MAVLKQSTSYARYFKMVLTSDHVSAATGKTVTVTLSKATAAFGAAAGAVTEVSDGHYYVFLTPTDTNTLGELAFHCTAAACDATDFVDQVQSHIFQDLSLNASGEAKIASSIKQNQALAGFTFVMTDSTLHSPTTGLSVTAQRSLGSAGFASCSNTVTEVASGVYSIDLSAGDLNSPTIMLKFTATSADDLNILIITQP